jgi:hypothetical protein
VLIDLLFPDKTERNGLHSLRELVYELRSLGVPLETDQDGVELPCAAVRRDYVDMLTSERLTVEQVRAVQSGLLPGYSPNHSETYSEWFDAFQAKTSFALSQVLLRDQARARDVGNLELSEAAARACLAISPLNEKAVKALAETVALGGATADAEQLLDDYAAEVGTRSPDLKLSAQMLKRRIRERLPENYRPAGELPFAGRDSEMLELRRRLASSRTGRTECAIVVGEPGIGKTRLVSEFAALATLENCLVERAAAQPHDRMRPMSVFVDMVPRLLQLPGALGVSPESMDALRRLTTRSSISSEGPPPGDPEVISRAISLALDDLISAVTGESHLTVIVEDAHWCDPLSLRVLAELTSRRLREFFVLLTSRERDLHELGDRFAEDAAVITLLPLELVISQDIIGRALRGTDGEGHEELHAWMADVANGSPFFISLLVAHFVATGAAFALPPSLQDLILKRLDSLDAGATVILQTCVLLGSLATLPRLVASLDLKYIDAVAAVSRLDSLRIMRWVDDRLLPSHSLIADVLMKRTANCVTRMLHLRIAAVLEAELTPGESPTVLWNCAEHWVAAGEHGRAMKFLRQCADHARDIGRPGAAAEVLLRIASLHLNATSRIAVLQEAVRLAKQAFEHGLVLRGVEMLRTIEPLALHDDIELAELHVLSVTNRDSDNYERRALACVQASEVTAEHRVRAALSALQWADAQSKPEFAARIASRVLDADLENIEDALSLEYQLVYQTVLGDPLTAGEVARSIQAIAANLPTARSASLLINASRGLLHAGATDDAIAAARFAYQRAESCGGARLQMQAALLLAGLLLDVGRPDLSKTWRARAAEARERNPHLFDEFEYRSLEIDFCLAEGNLAGARTALSNAERDGAFNSRIRQRWQRILNARLRQLSGEALLSLDEIATIGHGATESVPSTGIRDVEVAVIYTALRAHGRHAEALAVLRDFLQSRRRHSRAPLSRVLRRAIEGERLEDLLPLDVPVAICTDISPKTGEPLLDGER